jgi:hypothetical protein
MTAPAAPAAPVIKPSAMDDYLFDLRGYIPLKGVVSRSHVSELNEVIDGVPPLEPNAWHGHIHSENVERSRGVALQQIYEAGEPFERLIDHPAYIEHIKRYVGGEGSFDYLHGPLFIDENFVSLRGPHQGIGMHSGGFENVKRCQYQYKHGEFMCGQVNMLLALTDIGPGDGATMVIPGSHKSNMRHPGTDKHLIRDGAFMDGVEGAIEVYMQAGDVLLFVDHICHGSASRKNPGIRRIAVYRYGPSWGNFRFGYVPSPGLLNRLTPARRQIVYPWKHQTPPGSGVLAGVGQGMAAEVS